MLNYIPDGYTERGYIDAARGLHDALVFSFRPLLFEEREAVDEALAAPPRGESSPLVAAIALALVQWNLRDEHGCDVAVGREYVRRLRPALLDKLYTVVSGRAPSAPPPEIAPREVALLLEAAGAGCTPGEEIQG